MILKRALIVILLLPMFSVAYAGFTTSQKGIPLDSRRLLDGSTGKVIDQHYLDDYEQFKAIDENLAYLNCGKTFRPTSAFYLNLESFLELSSRNSEKKGEYLENCQGRVLISVDHYITPQNRESCSTLSHFNRGERTRKILSHEIVQGASISLNNDVTDSSAGYDFSILKTGATSNGEIRKTEGLNICPNPWKSYSKSDFILPQISFQQTIKASKTQRTLPGRTVSARCNLIEKHQTSPDKYSRESSTYIKHGCDAVPGASGAPLLKLSNGKVCVMGVQNIALKNTHAAVREFNEALDIYSPLFKKRMQEFLDLNCSTR